VSGLLRQRTLLRTSEPKRHYDVVVIGGGGHGLATAYYLASKYGSSVAVLERSYIGSGGTGRNTTVLRANYKTPQSVAFFKRSFEMYRELSRELDFNLLMSRRGLLWLAHSQDSLRVQRERALLNESLGVDTRFIDDAGVNNLCPQIDLSAGGHGRPILGASYHAPGSVIRHDAVVWGYAAAAQRHGVDIHQHTAVTGIVTDKGRATAVETTVGRISAGAIVSATAGYTSTIAAMVGVRLPIVTHPLQAFVTEPYKPILNRIVSSADLLVYVSQTARGEILVGAEIERYSTYSTRSTFSFLAESAARAIDLLPFTAKLRILRQWTGLCDMSPDYSPLMGPTEIDDFFVSAGWGTWGFKAIPAGGLLMAEMLHHGSAPSDIAPFRIDRFKDDRAIPDRSSAGTH
jgi:sarcosine oxidase, subunit beta